MCACKCVCICSSLEASNLNIRLSILGQAIDISVTVTWYINNIILLNIWKTWQSSINCSKSQAQACDKCIIITICPTCRIKAVRTLHQTLHHQHLLVLHPPPFTELCLQRLVWIENHQSPVHPHRNWRNFLSTRPKDQTSITSLYPQAAAWVGYTLGILILTMATSNLLRSQKCKGRYPHQWLVIQSLVVRPALCPRKVDLWALRHRLLMTHLW